MIYDVEDRSTLHCVGKAGAAQQRTATKPINY